MHLIYEVLDGILWMHHVAAITGAQHMKHGVKGGGPLLKLTSTYQRQWPGKTGLQQHQLVRKGQQGAQIHWRS